MSLATGATVSQTEVLNQESGANNNRKGGKRARIETTEPPVETPEKDHTSCDTASTSATQQPSSQTCRPRLLLASQELSDRLGKKYCDESDLLPLLLEHGLVRRIWTRTEEVIVEDPQGKTLNSIAKPKVAGKKTGGKSTKSNQFMSADGDSRAEIQPNNSDDAAPKISWSKLEIPLEMLQAHFHLPIVEASRAFDICTTRLKKNCRIHGIKRWPHRQVPFVEALSSFVSFDSHAAR
jgi:hypothetical protein